MNQITFKQEFVGKAKLMDVCVYKTWQPGAILTDGDMEETN